MAHRKFIHDKIQSIEKTWHGLEDRVKSGEFSLDNCWLAQWDIIARDLVFPNGKATPFKTLVCNDNEEILVGNPFRPSFVPVLNSEFLNMIREATAGAGHELTTCGSIRNRGRVFVSFRLKGMESFEAAGKKYSAFLNFGNGHDKSSVLWTGTSNTCTVCDNTYSANLVSIENKDLSGSQREESDDIKAQIRHTKNAKIHLPDLAKTIDAAIGVQAQFKLELDKLASEACDAKKAEELFTGFLASGETISTRTENRVTRMVQLFAKGAGNRGETMEDAFSAVTDYFSHESVGDNREKQFLSSEFGAGNVMKNRFFDTITNPDKRAETIQRGAQLLAAN